MIQFDNAVNATVEPPSARSSVENLTCLTIRTGSADCIARFYPALYQLTLVKNGLEEKIDLGFSGSRLLERLVRNPGEVVDRDELMSHAWSGRVVGQGSLNQQIYTLRQILNDEKAREIIQTLPRRGYLLNPNYINLSLEVVAPPVPDEPAQPVQPIPEPKKLTPAPSKWSLPIKLLPMALVGMLGVIALGTSLIWNQHSGAANLLTLTYSAHNAEELAQLRPFGEDLNRRLASNLSQPLHLILGLHENAMDVVCLHADGTAHTLHFPLTKVAQVQDSELSGCLP
jgi:DNA-binding winged helix-turn-helix (wHTH) protein